jgi:hypothetical protein
MDAHNHSLRIQKRQLERVFQSKTLFLASSAASLGVGLGVREIRSGGGNSFFGLMVDEELSAREKVEVLGGYIAVFG